MSWPAHDTARLTEAFRRAVRRLVVRLALFDEEQAAGMRTWPHAGFHVHTAFWVPEDDRAVATRRARYGARHPVALERLTYDRSAKAVRYRSDTSAGPTAGMETVDRSSSSPGSSCTFRTRATSPRGTTAGTRTVRAGGGGRPSP